MLGKSIRRRNLKIRADVNYVNAEEAKKLIAVEGYAVLDVRDKSQYNRAHIKSCYHVPLFIENQDNDLGNILFLLHLAYFCLLFMYGLLHLLKNCFGFCWCRDNYKEDCAQQFFGVILRASIYKTES